MATSLLLLVLRVNLLLILEVMVHKVEIHHLIVLLLLAAAVVDQLEILLQCQVVVLVVVQVLT